MICNEMRGKLHNLQNHLNDNAHNFYDKSDESEQWFGKGVDDALKGAEWIEYIIDGKGIPETGKKADNVFPGEA